MFIVMIKDLASASNQHLQLPYEVHTAHHNSNTTNGKGNYLLLPNEYQDFFKNWVGLSIPSLIPTMTTDMS